jgi:hypothetical protein
MHHKVPVCLCDDHRLVSDFCACIDDISIFYTKSSSFSLTFSFILFLPPFLHFFPIFHIAFF